MRSLENSCKTLTGDRKMKGIVKRINLEKGYGFIRAASASGEEYFFHKSALKNVKIEDLEEGTEVEFEDSDGAKGPRAEDIYA
jgi:CspA family cold shock protein